MNPLHPIAAALSVPCLAALLLSAMALALCTRVQAARRAVLMQSGLMTLLAVIGLTAAPAAASSGLWPALTAALLLPAAGIALGWLWQNRQATGPEADTPPSALWPNAVWTAGAGAAVALAVLAGTSNHAAASGLSPFEGQSLTATGLAVLLLALLRMARSSGNGFRGPALLQAGHAAALTMLPLDTYPLLPSGILLALLPALLTEAAAWRRARTDLTP